MLYNMEAPTYVVVGCSYNGTYLFIISVNGSTSHLIAFLEITMCFINLFSLGHSRHKNGILNCT